MQIRNSNNSNDKTSFKKIYSSHTLNGRGDNFPKKLPDRFELSKLKYITHNKVHFRPKNKKPRTEGDVFTFFNPNTNETLALYPDLNKIVLKKRFQTDPLYGLDETKYHSDGRIVLDDSPKQKTKLRMEANKENTGRPYPREVVRLNLILTNTRSELGGIYSDLMDYFRQKK